VVDDDSIHADLFKVIGIGSHHVTSEGVINIPQGCDKPFVKINWKQQVTRDT
jgi:hypothetical protein